MWLVRWPVHWAHSGGGDFKYLAFETLEGALNHGDSLVKAFVTSDPKPDYEQAVALFRLPRPGHVYYYAGIEVRPLTLIRV